MQVRGSDGFSWTPFVHFTWLFSFLLQFLLPLLFYSMFYIPNTLIGIQNVISHVQEKDAKVGRMMIEINQ